jgi:uncharacterized protein
MRLLVLADTHIRSGQRRRLPPAVYRALESADVVLHAGDVVTSRLLDELSQFAPTYAVLGNNDHTLEGELSEQLCLELARVRIGMVHDSGPRKGRAPRLHRRFPDAHVVVYGHSHEPFDGLGVDGQRLFNPGSPTMRRRAPRHTMGILELGDGVVTRHDIIAIERT